jgi:heme-degrading monooxygenase HmoA
MVARVTLAEIDVVRRNPARGIEVFEESVVPALEQQEGYLGCYLLLSDEGKVAVITFWTSDEAARASRLSGFYQEQIEKFTEEFAIFRSKPGRDSYDVAVAHAPAAIGYGSQ